MQHILVVFLLGLFARQNIFAKQVCYDRVGCFTNDPPFDKFPLPDDPNFNEPTFLLLKKDKPPRVIQKATELNVDDLIITTHGWGGSYNSTYKWNSGINANLLKARPTADLLFIDWEKLSTIDGKGAMFYHLPASNTRVISAWTALWLRENPKFDSTKVYCVGFSLGSHVCGMIAKRLGTKFGRISAIEPALMGFYLIDDPVGRVDVSDGIFVDVLHTSWAGLKRQLGHVDFYVNGANFQPGCPQNSRRRRSVPEISDKQMVQKFLNAPSTNATLYFEVWDLFNQFACSHYRGAYLFAHTITPDCKFLYCPCPSLEHYQKGHCRSCSDSEGALLGYRSFESGKTGKFYGATSGKAPYCLP